jgi:methionyl aminopeptidase
MTITNSTQRADLIEAGKRLARVLQALRVAVVPGVTTGDLEDIAVQMIREGGDEPCFLGYTPEGAGRPFPASLCVSINDEIVHGIPNENSKTLKEGDIIGLDLGLRHNGMIVDSAITVGAGEIDEASKKLMRVTEEALTAGIVVAQVGNHVGDISYAIQQVIEGAGLKVIKELGGHGVGEKVHEEPFVPNFGKRGTGSPLEEGMVLALEPISTAGKAAVIIDADGYTYRTKDGSRSAHFEHTILIEKTGTVVVTR